MKNDLNKIEKWTLAATILGSGMVFIDTSTLNVVLPAIQKDLGISGKSLFWIINAYSLFLSSLLLVGGSIGDIYGRKKIFIIGIMLFSVSSFFCGISPGKGMLITARAFQGVGGALMVPGSLAIISAVIPPRKKRESIRDLVHIQCPYYDHRSGIRRFICRNWLMAVYFFYKYSSRNTYNSHSCEKSAGKQG